MTTLDPRGRFVWHDLMSTDAEASKAFYTSLFGWRIVQHEGLGPYDMLHVGDMPIGGIIQMDPEMARGAPSHWVPYVNVEDADACVARSADAGGTTIVPVTELPGTGRFSYQLDPQGASLACFQNLAADPPPLPATPPPGAFFWDELHSKDVAASKAYYGETFGWTFREMDMGPAGIYHLIVDPAGKDCGGVMETPGETPSEGHHAWLSYVGCEDVDTSHAKATELKAGTIIAPKDIPGMGRFSVMTDPTGCVFALYQSATPGQ